MAELNLQVALERHLRDAVDEFAQEQADKMVSQYETALRGELARIISRLSLNLFNIVSFNQIGSTLRIEVEMKPPQSPESKEPK